VSRLTASLILLLTAATAHAVPLSYPVCTKPDGAFGAFLHKFVNDHTFQTSRIALPLVTRLGDGVTAESTLETWNKTRLGKLKDVLIYTDAERKQNDLIQTVGFVHSQPDVAEVFQGQKDADSIKLEYWFRKHEGCWYLAEFDDWSE